MQTKSKVTFQLYKVNQLEYCQKSSNQENNNFLILRFNNFQMTKVPLNWSQLQIYLFKMLRICRNLCKQN